MYYCGYASHIQDCYPRHDGISSTKNLLDNSALRIFSWSIAVLAISFNLFVIFARCYLWQGSSELHKVQSLCITALAVADLIMGLYMLIISVTDQIYKGRYHLYSHLWSRSILCRFSGLLAVVSSEVSALLLVFMALERYTLLVWNPFHRSEASIRNTMTWIAGCWIIGSNGSSTTLSSRYTITNFNGQSVTFSRQNSSQMQLTARIRKEPLQGRRSNPVTQRQAPLLAPPLSALLTTGPIMTDSNVKESSFSVPKLNDTQTADLDTDEDQGIVVLNTSNAEEPLTSSPKWDW
ncbi:hypothetical protein RvY_00247-3 [Ramazzottius varieornatus]|uniref:G-protein coupled receptors family 1 profile domain-containing protein n=1 Tax=Ramazzottius varieornatus TaxID=947166 RepID=A0A1D1UG79_RAMVA|nr:hypothetical protein RvY_00247-3 [Ramazzottius varieornatus]